MPTLPQCVFDVIANSANRNSDNDQTDRNAEGLLIALRVASRALVSAGALIGRYDLTHDAAEYRSYAAASHAEWCIGEHLDLLNGKEAQEAPNQTAPLQAA